MQSSTPSATAAAASPIPFHGPRRLEHQSTRLRARAAALATVQEQSARILQDPSRLTAVTTAAVRNTSVLRLQWRSTTPNLKLNPKVGTLFQFLQTPKRAWVCSVYRRMHHEDPKTACIPSMYLESDLGRRRSGLFHLLRLYVHAVHRQPNLPIPIAMTSCIASERSHWELRAVKVMEVVWDVARMRARLWTFLIRLISLGIRPVGQCRPLPYQ
jgi:hypothetical protein